MQKKTITINRSRATPLEVAFSTVILFQHGTLSHSHLCVGLLCLNNGAQWDLFPEHKGKGLEILQTGPAGVWNRAALCGFSPALAEFFSGRPLSRGAVLENLSGRAKRGIAHFGSSQRPSNARAGHSRNGIVELLGQCCP